MSRFMSPEHLEARGCGSCPFPIPAVPHDDPLDLLTATNYLGQTPVGSGDPIPFSNTGLAMSDAIQHTPGSGDFILAQPGVYEVLYHLIATPARTNLLRENPAVILNLNGVQVAGSFSEAGVIQDAALLSGGVAIPVPIAPATLQVLNIVPDFMYNSAYLLIRRL